MEQISEPTTPQSARRSESPLFFLDETPRRQAHHSSTKGREGSTYGGEDGEDSSDVDLDADPHSKLMELVAQKRKELETKEKEEAERRERHKTDVEDNDDDDDDEGPDRHTQGEEDDDDDSLDGIIYFYPEQEREKQKPRKKQQRKASKKAIEDMHRETQRMARNMQLTHEAKTRKTITMDNFLSRFNRKSQSEHTTSQDTGTNGQAEAGTSPFTARGNEHEQNEHEERDFSASAPSLAHHENSKTPAGRDVISVDEDEDALPSAMDLIDRIKLDPQSFQPKPPSPPPPEPESQRQPSSTSRKETMQPDPFTVDPHTAQSSHETNSTAKRTNRPKLSETKQVRVRLSRQAVEKHQQEASSDEDLEIVTNPGKARRIAVFERMPYRSQQRNQESSGWAKQLRILAQLPSNPAEEHGLAGEGRGSGNMTQKELEVTLFRHARQQAAKEREERIMDLKAKGIVLDAPEDRMEMEMEVEDLLEKARQEGKNLKKEEKRAEKAEQEKLNYKYRDDIEDDSEWEGEDEDEDQNSNQSHDEEEEEMEDEDEEEDEGEKRQSENDAVSGDEVGINDEVDKNPETKPESASYPEKSGIPDLSNAKDSAPTMGLSQAFASTLADGALNHASGADGLEEEVHENNQIPDIQSGKNKDKPSGFSLSQAFASTYEDPTTTANSVADATSHTREDKDDQIPDIGPGDSNGELGLSQAFQATYAEPEEASGDKDNSNANNEKKRKEQESLALLRDMSNAESQMPDVILPSAESSYQPRSDIFATPAKGNAAYEGSITPATRSRHSFSQAPPEPTQDEGFVYSPFDYRKRFLSVDHNTQSPTKSDYNDTINVLGTPVPSRSSENHPPNPDGDADRVAETPSWDRKSNNSNSKRSKPSKASREEKRFQKKNSRAKDIVDDAALESDDEYAGLGGLSDDSDGEGEEIDREMIDDDNKEAVDGKQLAAMNAEHIRRKDEVEVNKLFHDITTGALRRRRRHPGAGGNDYDLSDSDEERYIARRRAKQREFARMRRELLEADERVGAIAHDPKKTAFLRTIEDRAEDEDSFDFTDSPNTSGTEHVMDSQTSASSVATAPDAGKVGANQASERSDNSTAHKKDHQSSKRDKARTLAEIKESLAFLVGNGDAPAPDTEERMREDSDDEMDYEVAERDHENRDISQLSGHTESMAIDDEDGGDNDDDDELNGPSQAMTSTIGAPPSQTTRSKPKFVDRLYLRRAASINAATAASNNSAPYGRREDQSHILKGPTPLLRKISRNAPDNPPRPLTARDPKPASTAPTVSADTNGGKQGAGINYYAVARERQRELDLRANERTINGKSKLTGKKTAKIAAARKSSGGGLTKWLMTKENGGFE